MRRRRAEKREVIPDPKYKSAIVSRFINIIMKEGKKSTAEHIVYRCFEILAEKTGKPAIDVFQKALDNARPLVEIKPRRIGGATYQIPIEVRSERGISIAMRWVRNFARVKKGKPMEIKLADELLDAFKGEGPAVKKKEDTHKMAEANKAFAHYRW